MGKVLSMFPFLFLGLDHSLPFKKKKKIEKASKFQNFSEKNKTGTMEKKNFEKQRFEHQ